MEVDFRLAFENAPVGLVIGLIIGWTTILREGSMATIGAIVGMLGFDFYWRFVRDSLPGWRNR